MSDTRSTPDHHRERSDTSDRAVPDAPGHGAFLAIDVARLFGWLRAGLVTIVAATVLGAVLAVGYAMLTPARYTATAELIVDPANLQILQDDLYPSSQQSDVPLLRADSQLRVLTSRNVLHRVVERLDLQNDPEFNEPPRGLRAMIFGAGPRRDPVIQAREELAKRVGASREERSFAVTVSAWSHDAEKAATITNAMIDAFREELAQGDAAGAARAAQTLLDRLAGLRGEVTEAEQRVEAFRAENDLQMADGQLSTTRSMTEFNALIVAAQARLSEAETRYQSLSSAADDPQNNVSVLQSDTVSRLKEQHAALSQRSASYTQIYGPRHPALTTLSQEMADIDRAIRTETQRIVNAARNEMEQARANLASLRAGAANTRALVDDASEAEVRLRELQRDAESKASVYEAFLSRAGQVSERQQIDSTNIRVISPAIVPVDRSWPPRTSRLGIVGLLAGFAIGIMIAIGRGLAHELRPQWAVAAPTPARRPESIAPVAAAAPSEPSAQPAPIPGREIYTQDVRRHDIPSPAAAPVFGKAERPSSAGRYAGMGTDPRPARPPVAASAAAERGGRAPRSSNLFDYI